MTATRLPVKKAATPCGSYRRAWQGGRHQVHWCAASASHSGVRGAGSHLQAAPAWHAGLGRRSRGASPARGSMAGA